MSRLLSYPRDAAGLPPLSQPLSESEQTALDALLPLLTPPRRERFAAVLSQRTQHLTVVLEGLRQTHNFSAVLRSCDAFGVQSVHVVDPFELFEPGRFHVSRNVAMGAQKWLRLHAHETIESCVASLRGDGYRIAATAPATDSHPATPLAEFDLAQPVALLMGNELEGLSDAAIKLADERLAVPLAGFVESLNVSVAAAICLYDLTHRLRSGPIDWALAASARERLLLDWTRLSIPNAAAIESRLTEASP